MIDQATVTALAIKAGVIDSADMESIHISKAYINDLTNFAELAQQMITRKPLTEREIISLALNHELDTALKEKLFKFVRAIELVHKIEGEE